jgi:osmotically-inducible protein OsmY
MKQKHQSNLRALLVAAALAALAQLQGCVPLIATGVGAGALMADDRRTAGIYIEDEGIENKALLRVDQKHSKDVHLNLTSFNRVVLLTGEAPSEDVRSDITQIVRGIDNVKSVHNEIAVAQPTTLMLRSNDAVLTSKVKARFVDANKFRANHVKVVTENSVVYLMGLVKRQEAADAAEIARTTGGVHRVVRVFEYMD